METLSAIFRFRLFLGFVAQMPLCASQVRSPPVFFVFMAHRHLSRDGRCGVQTLPTRCLPSLAQHKEHFCDRAERVTQ